MRRLDNRAGLVLLAERFLCEHGCGDVFGFGALPRFLNFRLVDLLSGNGQVRQDGHVVTRDFDHALAYGQGTVAALFTDNYFAWHHLRH